MIEEDELIRIWQSSSNQDRIKFETSKLILDMKSSLDRFHKSVKYRDLTEFLNAIIMIPILIYVIYAIPYTLTKIAAFLLVLFLIYVVIKLRRLNKHKPNTLSDSYMDYLYQCKHYLSLQKKMRETAPYWYLLPLLICTILFTTSVILGKDIPLEQITWPLIIMSAIIIGGAIFVYLYNAWIIRKQYIPRLEKMEALIKAMES